MKSPPLPLPPLPPAPAPAVSLATAAAAVAEIEISATAETEAVFDEKEADLKEKNQFQPLSSIPSIPLQQLPSPPSPPFYPQQQQQPVIVLYKNSQFPLSAFFPQQPPPPPLLLLLPATNVDIDDVDTTDQTHHFFLDSPLTSLLTDYIKPTLHLENDVVVEFPDLKLQLHESSVHCNNLCLRQLYDLHYALIDSQAESAQHDVQTSTQENATTTTTTTSTTTTTTTSANNDTAATTSSSFSAPISHNEVSQDFPDSEYQYPPLIISVTETLYSFDRQFTHLSNLLADQVSLSEQLEIEAQELQQQEGEEEDEVLNQEPQHQDVVDSIHNQTGVLALNSHGEPVGDYYFQEEGFIVGGQEEDGYYAQQELQQQDEQAAADVAGQEEEQGMDMDTTITNDIIVPSSADAAVAAANADGFVVVFEDHINEYSQEVQEEEGQDGEVYQDQEDEESSAAAPSQQLYLQSAEYYDEVGGAVTVTENEGDELVQQNQDQQYPHETNHQVSGDYDGQEEDQEIVAADSSIAAALVASSSGYHHEGGDGGHIVSASYSEQLVYHAEQGGEEGQDDIGMNERAEENVGFEKLQEQPQHCDHDHNMMLVDADGVNNSAADDEASLLQDPQEYEQVQQQQQQHDIVSSAIHQQLPLEQLQQVEDGGEQEGAEADTGYEVILETTGGAAAAAVVVVEGSTGIDGGVSVGQEEDAYYAEEQIIDGGDAEGEFVEAQYQGQDQGYYEQEGYDYVEGEQEVDGAGYFDGSVDHEQPQQEVLVSSLSSLEPAAGLVTTIIDGDASTSAGGYLKRKEGEFVSDDSSVEISVQEQKRIKV